MDGDNSLTSVEEMTSPSSPKRPRPDHTEANNGKKLFLFPQLLTFQKAGFLQQNTSQTCLENQHLQTTNIQDQSNLNNFGTDLNMQSQTSNISMTDVTETDRLILNMLYDLDGATTASHDCSSLGKSLQCEPHVVFSPDRNDTEEGRQVQNSSTHVQIVTLTRAEEDVRCQVDCGYEEAPRDEGTDMQNGAPATAEVSNQREIEYELSEKLLCNKQKEQVKKDSCPSHFGDGESFSTKPEVCPPSSLVEAGENNSKTLELQSVTSCDGKTECSESRKQSFASAGERDVGMVAENMSMVYAKDECEATKETTVKELCTEVGIETADDTTETLTSVSISQVITEGDNDAASFSVIDPAMGSGADRPVEQKLNAGFERFASEKVCKMDKKLILDIKALQGESVKLPSPEETGQLAFQSLEQQQCKYEKDGQSNTDICIEHDKTSGKSNIDNGWRPTSPCSGSSAIFDSAEDQRMGSQGTVEAGLKEKNQSGSHSDSFDHPEAQKVERSQGDMARIDETREKDITEVVALDDDNELWLKEVVLQKRMYKVTTKSAHSNSWNESGCSSWVQGGTGLVRFATDQNIACKEAVNTCTETAVEGRDIEEEINEQEMTSVASEQLESNMADFQLTVLNKIVVEREMMESKENEVKDDHCERAQIELVLEENKVTMAEGKHSICKALTENIVGSMEHQGENATVQEKSLQHHATMMRLLPFYYQTFCNTIKPTSDKEMAEKTLTANLCAAESNDIVSVVFSTSSDAVVPGVNNLGINSLSFNSNDRFSPLPSAFLFTKRAPIGGFDTFEKIQFSPDDSGMDSSALSNVPLLASPPCQMLERRRQQVHQSQAASHDSDKTEKAELSSAYEHGSLSNHNTCNEVPSPISAADVIAWGWPEQKPLCESAFQIYDLLQDDSNPDSFAVTLESNFSDCEGSDRPKFEKKTQYDTVLKELKLFFDISASDMVRSGETSSPEPLMEITEALEGKALKCKDLEESLEEPDVRGTSLDDPVEDVSLECEGVVMGSGAKSREGEQEVPLSRCEPHETSTCNQLKDTEAGETEQRQRMWLPSFMSQPLVEQLTQKLLQPQRRLEPLTTCSRPIRVGLSKRAKISNLHHTHPYK